LNSIRTSMNIPVNTNQIKEILHRIADQYPDLLQASQHADVERMAFHIELVIGEKGLDASLCDLGGGDGLFVLGVPNCVNLRKRITVPFGIGKWSHMRDWYEPAVFRGHVREPDVQDLKYIAGDMQLKNYRIIGRNWLGYSSKSRLVRKLTLFTDYLLRMRPSLCSDIYLIGRS
jgi:hypothetical protein